MSTLLISDCNVIISLKLFSFVSILHIVIYDCVVLFKKATTTSPLFVHAESIKTSPEPNLIDDFLFKFSSKM